MLPLLIIIHHLVNIIHSKRKGAHHSASHHRNNNTPLRRFDQTRPAMWPTLFLPGMQSNSTRERIPGKKKKEKRVKSSAWKEKKNTHKSLHISSMSSLHLSHCTDAHILYKNHSTTHKSPRAGPCGGRNPCHLIPNHCGTGEVGPNQPSLILICTNKKGP